jgi:hypothetical protein
MFSTVMYVHPDNVQNKKSINRRLLTYMNICTSLTKVIAKVRENVQCLQFNIQFNQQNFYLIFYTGYIQVKTGIVAYTWTFFYRPLDHLELSRLQYPLPTPYRGEAGQVGGDSSCRLPLLTDRHLKPHPPPPPSPVYE